MLRRLYDCVSHSLPAHIGWPEFEAYYADWHIEPLAHAGCVIGATVTRGAEIHVVYFDKPRGSIIGHIRATLARIVDEFGYAETYIEPENTRGLAFCRRLGFIDQGMRRGVHYLRCGAVNQLRQK